MAEYKTCPYCGDAGIEPGSPFCGCCGKDIRQRAEPESPVSDNAAIVPDRTIHAQSPPGIPLAHVVITEGLGTGSSFQLGESTRIGRDRTRNQVILGDKAVSGAHGKINYEDRHFVYYDVGSTNGSWLMTPQGVRQRVKGPVPLRDGDKLKLGDTTLVFREAPRD